MFYYDLPKELIAQEPLTARTDSRLMALDRKTGNIRHMTFKSITGMLNKNDCIVLNDTKVIPARLMGTKSTGAKIEVLLLERVNNGNWKALVRPGRRIKENDVISFADGLLKAIVKDSLTDGVRIMELMYDGVFEEILETLGETPLPPYITTKLKDKSRYQTVYAAASGSAAAPTAGLHFTKELLEEIKQKGVAIAKLTLHVGLGTFRPIKAHNILEHEMHSEFYSIDEQSAHIINTAKSNGGRVICVGTTSVRCLETVCDKAGYIKAGKGYTNIFIYPGYNFKITNGLITNFHLPESTLMALVAAFAGTDNVLSAYNLAVENKYRFFSFGDCMVIL